MSLSSNYKKILLSSCLLTASALTGCGGGGGGSEPPEITNQAPTAEIIGANRAVEHQQANLRADVADIDGTVAAYSWSVAGIDLVLSGADTAEVSFTAPSVEQDTSFTVHLTVTDNDGATVEKSMVFTSERIFDTLLIQGLVTDEPLVRPQVTLDVGDESFTTIGNSNGVYVFRDIEIDERNFDKLVKITAIGDEQYNPGVKLVSLLESFRTLVSYETSQEYIIALDYFGLNVTNVTTAKYVLAMAANGNQPFDNESQLNAILDTLDHKKVLEVAGVLKVIIDSEEYALPDTVSDTLALVSVENQQVYDETLATINAEYNVLTTAIEQILGDENLVENPDFDADGLVDHEDPDIDNDGVLNEDDYFDRDKNKSLPEIGMINYPWDAEYGSWLEFCIRESVNPTIKDRELYDPYTTYKTIPADEVTELYCSGSGLVDISALTHFPNLKVLELAGTKVSDISILAQLTQLEQLLIQGIPAEDFSALAQLTKLQTLNMGGTNFSDTSVLSNSTNLQVLNISDTYISDLVDIALLTKLKQLDISGTQVTDLSLLESASDLQLLYAHKAKVVELADFSKLAQLTQLTLFNNEISDISTLASLVQITKLDLSKNKIIDTAALGSLVELTELNLSNNQLANTDGLSTLSKLSMIDLSYNLLDSDYAGIAPGTLLSGLANKPLLTSVDLSHNQINSNVNDLAQLTQSVALIDLDLSNNNLLSMQGVSNFTLLQDFDASDNNLTSISELANLTALEQLDLANNNIEDISPLSKLTALNKLLLSKNEIVNIDVLNSWESLPLTLWLQGNVGMNCMTTPLTNPITPLSAVEQLQIKADEQNINFKSPCEGVIARPAIEEPAQIMDILDQELTDYMSSGISSLGQLERITCMNQFHDGYPLCWVANVPSFWYPQCTAELNAPLMTCTDGPEEGNEYPYNSGNYWKSVPFTVDYDFTLQTDNQFVSTFDNRLLITLLKNSTLETDIKCLPLDDEGEASCTMTGDFFNGEISWTQYHTDEHIPRCSGEIGSSLATCTPGPSLEQIQAAAKTIDELPVLNTDYNFEVDLSTIEITPVQDRDYPCIPGAQCF
ncbi:leucine-rich repeat domain-containing protein [Thalassotalea fonticola]|uniref:Leucine-rich repeat domain-containing protein n=1 Tax=Thalassotalea fonticola TaxID=3065649 RepID=A0ABZ0GRP1_9GAMM|nr:leucine-rich repeat domain-containing protein [Colwelliaceae bacterium S1-1]